MKHYRRFRLFLETLNTITMIGGTAFLIWWLWTLLPTLLNVE